MITAEQVKIIMPKCPMPWCDAIVNTLPNFEINTPERIAAFLSQVAHESVEYTVLQENLYYTMPERIMQVWPARFHSVEMAKPYTENPAKLASFVYANRGGNGDEESGDGYKYRGRGGIQRTFKNNYQRFKDVTGKDVINYPEMLISPETGVLSDCVYWQDNRLNDYANDVIAVSRGVNLGNVNSKVDPHGLLSRQAYYTKALSILG